MNFVKINNSELKKTIINYKKKIKDVIELFEYNHLQIALITDKKNTLLGIMTDGDLRRCFLNGCNLETCIDGVYNKKIFSINKNIKNYKNLMLENNLYHLPIIDKKKPIGLIVSETLYKYNKKNNIFIILAGGRGERLKPRTNKTPKPLLKISGKSILQRTIERGSFFGFKKFNISTNYLGNLIKKEIGNGKKFNIKIKYINENFKMGTAGSLSLIKDLGKEPVIVVNGDILTNINYHNILEFHIKNKSDFTTAVFKKEFQNPYGVVKTVNNRLKKIEEKPISISTIIAGIYVINPSVIKKNIKKSFLNMTDLINTLLKIKKIKLMTYNVSEEWMDVGTENDYLDANIFYNNYNSNV